VDARIERIVSLSDRFNAVCLGYTPGEIIAAAIGVAVVHLHVTHAGHPLHPDTATFIELGNQLAAELVATAPRVQ
jgi:hypothetical protein